MTQALSAIFAALLVPLLALTAVAQPSTAEARPPLTRGKVVDGTSGSPVGGATVRLHAVTRSGGLGPVLATDETSADGSFGLYGATSGQPVLVELVAGRYQQGVAGDLTYNNGSVHRLFYAGTPSEWTSYAAGSSLGKVQANPAFLRGRLVDAESGTAVVGVTVRAVVVNGPTLTTTSGRGGTFAFTGIGFDGGDANLRITGGAVGYESGWTTCFSTVAPYAQACATSIGRLPEPIRMDAK